MTDRLSVIAEWARERRRALRTIRELAEMADRAAGDAEHAALALAHERQATAQLREEAIRDREAALDLRRAATDVARWAYGRVAPDAPPGEVRATLESVPPLIGRAISRLVAAWRSLGGAAGETRPDGVAIEDWIPIDADGDAPLLARLALGLELRCRSLEERRARTSPAAEREMAAWRAFGEAISALGVRGRGAAAGDRLALLELIRRAAELPAADDMPAAEVVGAAVTALRLGAGVAAEEANAAGARAEDAARRWLAGEPA